MRVIAQFENNQLTNIYSFEFFEKNILGSRKWMIRLSSLDDMSKQEEHVYAEGNASDIIDKLKGLGTWDTWIISEIPEEDYHNIFFEVTRKEYIVKVKSVA